MFKEDKGPGIGAIVLFGLVWLISAGLSITFIGVVIWAIIQLVNHFTKT